MEELINELRGLIAESLKLEPETLEALDKAAPLFDEGLGLDSIDALELVFEKTPGNYRLRRSNSRWNERQRAVALDRAGGKRPVETHAF